MGQEMGTLDKGIGTGWGRKVGMKKWESRWIKQSWSIISTLPVLQEFSVIQGHSAE